MCWAQAKALKQHSMTSHSGSVWHDYKDPRLSTVSTAHCPNLKPSENNGFRYAKASYVMYLSS